MKILIIEDESEMRRLIRHFLQDENYLVEEADDFRTGMQKISSFNYDCILLDIMLPDGNGLKLLRELKNHDKVGSVIILSAKDSIADKVVGLELGADDYLTKPFHLAELNARIKSAIRRRNAECENFLVFENVKINLEQRAVSVDAAPIELNRKEFDILVFLTLNKNKIARKSAIAENIWGDYVDQSDDFDFIYSQIKNLRKKLRDNGAHVDIDTIYGLGYRLVVK